MSVIVLCGGSINHRNLPIAVTASNSMIPVNGKPVIGWIMDDLLSKGLDRIVVVVQEKNKKLQDFIEWAYSPRCELSLAFISEGKTILDSLLAGLDKIPMSEPLHIVLGDTLIRDSYRFKEDSVYSGQYENPLKWCLVKVDEQRNALTFFDKKDIRMENLEALAGYYFISNPAEFKNVVAECIRSTSKEISQALDVYKKKTPIRVVKTKEWYDFGHMDHLISAKRQLLQTRHFNNLVVDGERGVIVKTSVNNDKLGDELAWYKDLPKELSVLTPRIIEEIHEGGKVRITQELYGYPNMAELYVFSELDLDVWYRALGKLMDVHRLLKKHTAESSAESIRDMYIGKTEARMREYQKSPGIALDKDIEINGKKYPPLKEVFDNLRPRLETLTMNAPFTIIHGDYCFSNILYDLQTEIVRLIDPRGSFGRKGIYGDPRYDMAKLRHSIAGLYDFIISDLFDLKKEGDRQYRFRIFSNPLNDALSSYFDRLLASEGYKLWEIKLIEGLLFLSMLPLHKENPRRQGAMLIRSTLLLNEVLHENSH